MKVNRAERIAKAKGLTILGLMALVAFSVHFWPRTPALVVAPRPIVNAPSPAAANDPLAYCEPKRAPVPAARRSKPPVASVQTGATESPSRPVSPSPLRIVPLQSVPGAQLAMASAPEAPAAGPAVTRAMQKTGRSLAGAFNRTGTAFRRAF